MGAKRGSKNGAKSPLEEFGGHLGRQRCRNGESKSGPKIGPEKRRLLDREDALSGLARRNVRRSWALFLADFKQDLARYFTRSAPTGAADLNASRIPPGQSIYY